MGTTLLRNELRTNDPIISTPEPNDGSATTPYKDYLLNVEFVNQPLTIELFKNSNTSFDPFVQVYSVPKNSTGTNLVRSGSIPVAENDDDAGGLDAKIGPNVPASINNIPGQLTSQSNSDYVVRVSSFDQLSNTSLPQGFTLRVTTSSGNVTLKDPVTGATLDESGNSRGGGTTGGGTLSGTFAQTGNVPVRRFWDFVTGSHFYTAKPEEIADRLSSPSRYRAEGDEFISPGPGNVKVQRFLNTRTGTYFYTADPGSVSFVRNLPQFQDQGEVFNAFTSPVPGATPVYRFANLDAERRDSQAITHFYTADAANRQTVLRDFPSFRDEGIAFYAVPVPK